MTTPAAERLYRAQHEAEMEGKGWAVFNPHDKPIEELPTIYGFNNGGSQGWYNGVLLAEDGVCLGGHVCSHEGYMQHDLGILEGTRPDRHEIFRHHYPHGYRMVFVGLAEVRGHEGIDKAYALNQQLAAVKQAEEAALREMGDEGRVS